MNRFLLAFLLFAALTGGAFESADWKISGADRGVVFETNEFKDGVLRLKDSAKGKFNNFLECRLVGGRLAPFRGKRIVFSAEIRQISAGRAGTVGLTLNYKGADGKSVYRSTRVPGKEAAQWTPYSVTLDIPADAAAMGAVIECALGYNNTAEAEFRNIRLEEATAQNSWNTGTGSVIRRDRKPLFWRWNAPPEVLAELGKAGLTVSSSGRVTLAPADGRPLELAGSTPDQAELILEVTEPSPFKIDFLSFGKSNRTVEVNPASTDKAGRRKVRIPLEKFAPFQDLARFEGLVLTVEKPQTFVTIDLAGLDNAKEVVNMLPDPSFEESEKPESNYNLWADYRPEETGKGFRYDGRAFHGKRSLLIEPGGFFTWFAHDQRGKGAVFSVYAESDAPGSLELTLQNAVMDHHGAIAAPVYRAKHDTGTEWTRIFVACPLTGKMSPTEFNIYRAVVRNTGSVPIRIDAVQLEQDASAPRTFNPVRGSRFHYKIRETVPLEQYPGMKIGKNTKSGEVPLRVAGTSGRPATPVRGGVPFPAGELFDLGELQLVDAKGNEVPAQFVALARRPLDSSVISLGVDFQASPEEQFRLRYGRGIARKPDGRPIARQENGRIVIDTGARKFVLTPDKPSFLEGGDAFFAVKTPDGKIHRSPASLVKVEENGPERCMILLRGDAFLAWELRISAFRNLPYLEIDCSFENNFTESDPLYRLVRAVYLQLPAQKNADLEGKEYDSFESVTRLARAGEFRIENLLYRNGAAPVRLTSMPESFSSGRYSCYLENPSERIPYGFGFEPGAARIYMWPETGVNPLDVAAGLSGTMRVRFGDGGKPPVANRPVLQADPGWIRKSGVFGDFLTADEMRSSFPKTAKSIDDVFDATRGAETLTGMLGFGDAGDLGSRNYYRNHETSGVRNLWTRYLSTGDLRDFAMAARHSIHMRDVDQCHIRRGTTAVHPHNSWSNLTYNFHTGHYWGTGVVWHYLLTGDRRSLESALSSAAVLVQKSSIQYRGGRERHRMIYHLAELYELSGDPQLKAAFERQYDVGGASDPGSYYGGIAHEALYRLWQATGEQKYLDRLKSEATEFLAHNRKELQPMPEDRAASPTRAGSANEGRAAMMLFTGALAARLLDDPAYLPYLDRGDGDPLLWHMSSVIGRDNSLAWALPYLSAMRHFGISENPATPDNCGDLVRLTGRMQISRDEPFLIELTPGRDGKAVLDLYRVRSFRYWQYKRTGDKLTVKITAPDGRVLADETVYGNVPAEHRRIAVDAPDGKPVTAEVTFHNDCWGGVSSPNPYRIDARRYFGARSSVGVPLRFRIRAPKSGKLTVDWRWKNARNARAGEPLAVRLTAKDGSVAAHQIYTIPPDFPEEKGTSTYLMELEIPEKYRGEELVLELPDLKWIEWKLGGLDDPYLKPF
ncbi:MAG: hypothetical protein HPZ91_00985 [Lentisphaeria bacterium]|nr:hypothetical protein [Lentisphaeria bacterium]